MKTLRIEEKILRLKIILNKLQSNDPDPNIKIFCSVVYTEPIFYELSEDIFNDRPSLEEEHLIFLVFVSLQYLTKFSYDNENNINDQKVKNDLEKYKNKIHYLCIYRNVSTNIPQRYVALQIISSILYSKYKQPLTVVDIGCSLGLGLMALNTTFFEKQIEIDSKLSQFIQNKPTFERIIGIDIQEPDLEWVLASYLPETKDKRKLVKHVYSSLNNNGSKIEMIHGNALTLDEMGLLPPNIADIVWISNMCYQIEGEVEDVIKGVGRILRNGGLWLYAYYRYDIDEKINPETNPYVISIFKKDKNWTERIEEGLQNFNTYGMEVLEAPNEIVESLKLGRDYKNFDF